MSEARFTPGPWTQADRVVVAVPETHGYATWLANCSVGGCSASEQLANARLIAAAPDLFAACGQASFALRELLPNDPDAQMTVRILQAAIAKATGEQA